MDFPLQLASQLRLHLRALRKTRGLTQAALGQLVGVGQARIAEIENNPGAVSLNQLLTILSALQVSLVIHDNTQPAHRSLSPDTEPTPVAKPAAKPPSNVSTNHDAPSYYVRSKKGSW